MSNVFRVANLARYHMERTMLADHDLSFTAFTTLWVLWVCGRARGPTSRRRSRHHQGDPDRRGHDSRTSRTRRATNPSERRSASSSLLPPTWATPRWPTSSPPSTPKRITDHLSTKQKKALASTLRSIVRTLEDRSDGAGG
ncbi:MAG: hypothetical protein R2710_20280 [Acidimicrobiales bacterium]